MSELSFDKRREILRRELEKETSRAAQALIASPEPIDVASRQVTEPVNDPRDAITETTLLTDEDIARMDIERAKAKSSAETHDTTPDDNSGNGERSRDKRKPRIRRCLAATAIAGFTLYAGTSVLVGAQTSVVENGAIYSLTNPVETTGEMLGGFATTYSWGEDAVKNFFTE